VLPHEVVAKLHFIHLLVTSGSWLQQGTKMLSADFATDDVALNQEQKQ